MPHATNMSTGEKSFGVSIGLVLLSSARMRSGKGTLKSRVPVPGSVFGRRFRAATAFVAEIPQRRFVPFRTRAGIHQYAADSQPCFCARAGATRALLANHCTIR